MQWIIAAKRFQISSYIRGPARTVNEAARVAVNGTILQSTSASRGVKFARSVVCADCDYARGAVQMNFREYGIARFFTEISLFGGDMMHHTLRIANMINTLICTPCR